MSQRWWKPTGDADVKLTRKKHVDTRGTEQHGTLDAYYIALQYIQILVKESIPLQSVKPFQPAQWHFFELLNHPAFVTFIRTNLPKINPAVLGMSKHTNELCYACISDFQLGWDDTCPTFESSILAKIQQNATRCLCLETNVKLQLEKVVTCATVLVAANMLLMTDILHHLECIKPIYWCKISAKWCRISAVNAMGTQLSSIYATIGYTFRISYNQNWTNTPKQCYLHVTSPDSHQ